jgi:hypothetical protein
MQHLQGGGFRIYPCLFLASLLEEERRASDPNSQACAELFILVGGTPPPKLPPLVPVIYRLSQACPLSITTSPQYPPAPREIGSVS